MDTDDKPWWYYRCMHNTHEIGLCWQVLKEAEGVVVLLMVCMRDTPQAIHLTIDLDGIGSVCKPMSQFEYRKMTEVDLMKLVQSERRGLRSLTQTPWNQE